MKHPISSNAEAISDQALAFYLAEMSKPGGIDRIKPLLPDYQMLALINAWFAPQTIKGDGVWDT